MHLENSGNFTRDRDRAHASEAATAKKTDPWVPAF